MYGLSRLLCEYIHAIGRDTDCGFGGHERIDDSVWREERKKRNVLIIISKTENERELMYKLNTHYAVQVKMCRRHVKTALWEQTGGHFQRCCKGGGEWEPGTASFVPEDSALLFLKENTVFLQIRTHGRESFMHLANSAKGFSSQVEPVLWHVL